MAHMNTITSDEIPTRVLNERWIRCGYDRLTEPAEKRGKWMLFFDKIHRDEHGLTALDRAWGPIKNLVLEKELLSAKSSTGLRKDTKVLPAFRGNGVIMCHTNDYDDVEDVRSAALAIRKALPYYSDTFSYKTDVNTKLDKYRVFGSKNITLYQFDANGVLTKLDDHNTHN